ncbi:MAG: cysteine desulfurase [bacterium]|nr:cysteine desulfurase [bacterium]
MDVDDTLIYLDHAAHTPIDRRVAAAMAHAQFDLAANPHNRSHGRGNACHCAVERALEQIGSLVGATAHGVVLTSGATESNNLAILGAAHAFDGDHIVTCATEHSSVLEPIRYLERIGYQVTVLPVDRFGRIDPQGLAQAISPRTALVSLMWANNEIGTLHDLSEVVELAHRHAALVHSDATQAAGRVMIDLDAVEVDLLSISSHKLNGPGGVGALVIRDGVSVAPMIHGGAQQQGMRAGTIDALATMGFGLACEFANHELESRAGHLRTLRRLATILLP